MFISIFQLSHFSSSSFPKPLLSSHNAPTSEQFPGSKLSQAEAGLLASRCPLQGPPVPHYRPVPLLQEAAPAGTDLEEAEGERDVPVQTGSNNNKELFYKYISSPPTSKWSGRISMLHSIRLELIKALSIIGEASGSETFSDGLLYLEKAAVNLNSPDVFRWL